MASVGTVCNRNTHDCVEGKTCPESANPLRVLVVRPTINRDRRSRAAGIVPPSGATVYTQVQVK